MLLEEDAFYQEKLKRYDISELRDIEKSLDKEKYPIRNQFLLKEIARRESGIPPDSDGKNENSLYSPPRVSRGKALRAVLPFLSAFLLWIGALGFLESNIARSDLQVAKGVLKLAHLDSTEYTRTRSFHTYFVKEMNFGFQTSGDYFTYFQDQPNFWRLVRELRVGAPVQIRYTLQKNLDGAIFRPWEVIQDGDTLVSFGVSKTDKRGR